MKTFYNLNDFLKSAPSSGRFSVTIGVFDGVHRAHQKIIRAAVKKAKLRNLSTLLITFNPHPLNILNLSKRVPLLISLEHRLRLLKGMGIDYVIVLYFDKRLSQMAPADFIQKFLAKIRIAEITVGENFFFGNRKEGSLKELRKFSHAYGYKISFIRTLKSSGRVVSSTWIRELILKGDLKKASMLLARPVTVLGTVVTGAKKGRIIGYRTANVNPHHEAIPPSGVYAVRIRVQKRLHGGILNIGVRPTFDADPRREKDTTIDAHIFDFNKSIYGKEIEIIFIKRTRREKKFRNIDCLKREIAKDEVHAKQILRG